MVMMKLDKLATAIGDLVKAEVSSVLAAVEKELPQRAPNMQTIIVAPSVNLDKGNTGTIWPVYEYANPNATAKKNVGKKQVFPVPHDFVFPVPCLKNAWIIWFCG